MEIYELINKLHAMSIENSCCTCTIKHQTKKVSECTTTCRELVVEGVLNLHTLNLVVLHLVMT